MYHMVHMAPWVPTISRKSEGKLKMIPRGLNVCETGRITTQMVGIESDRVVASMRYSTVPGRALLARGLKHFLCSPLLGEMIKFD